MINPMITTALSHLFALTKIVVLVTSCIAMLTSSVVAQAITAENGLLQNERSITLNQKADGYRGIWYMNQPSNDQYVYKYSGGLGTYCAKHSPFGIYCPKVDKTFFCYGGAKPDNDRALLHMVSYFDHKTKTVPKPTILLDKKTSDAHDNPVISIDDKGHIWIFSTSHGLARPSYIHRSVKPYDIDAFELVNATRLHESNDTKVPIDNFSYMQVWHTQENGFAAFFTRYNYPAKRTICFMTSRDGVTWSRWQRIAAIDEGHYQISGMGQIGGIPKTSDIGDKKFGTMFNMHPDGKGLNWRTNLYYVQTIDNGKTWQTVDGKKIELPLTQTNNAALVRDYQAEGLNVYLKDVQFDSKGHPILLYITSKGYESGPENDPRTWTLAHYNGQSWQYSQITNSDNNYDFGELLLNAPDDWRLIAPTEKGPQEFNPGGEVAMWISRDGGKNWNMKKQLTQGSDHNHTYVRHIENAHPDFVALWADGHGRKPSSSKLYFCDETGVVYQLPMKMASATDATPEKVAK